MGGSSFRTGSRRFINPKRESPDKQLKTNYLDPIRRRREFRFGTDWPEWAGRECTGIGQ